MANEEQRRAFESYMGRPGSSNAQPQNPTQPVNQYPGSVAQPGNPYLYQVVRHRWVTLRHSKGNKDSNKCRCKADFKHTLTDLEFTTLSLHLHFVTTVGRTATKRVKCQASIRAHLSAPWYQLTDMLKRLFGQVQGTGEKNITTIDTAITAVRCALQVSTGTTPFCLAKRWSPHPAADAKRNWRAIGRVVGTPAFASAMLMSHATGPENHPDPTLTKTKIEVDEGLEPSALGFASTPTVTDKGAIDPHTFIDSSIFTTHEQYRAYPAPPETLPSRASKSDEVWPPPDIVRTQTYINIEKRPLRRQSSRIIELSPSPPPSRPRSARTVFRDGTSERRARSPSISPVRITSYKQRRDEEAGVRVASHHQPYRSVIPERRRSYRASDETSGTAESPTCSVPKLDSSDHRERRYYRRSSVRESEDSMHVEVGGPRVHFGGNRKSEAPDPDTRGRTRYVKEDVSREKSSGQYQDYSRSRPLHESRPASRQGEDYEKLRTRHYSVSRGKDYDDDVRVDKQRRIPPPLSPPLVSREYEEIHVRHISPLPIRRAIKTPPPSSSASSSHPPPPLYRHISATESHGRKSSVASPPPTRSRHSDDYTDSDGARSGDVTVVRSWKGIDERGRPTMFVEERRGTKMLAEGSEGGGTVAREYRDLGRGERRKVASRVWRDV
ncbi:hypothetical protein yc1106_04205 [Curvularia clavata]|uniref:Uncharacterized protein n=1 Tax=Curvularia clavata TaxID=95742 RepID=A0A9Q8Z5W9_CURCL|nr:hypothetical protein yc1106_04205 [Curvularia clavata]